MTHGRFLSSHIYNNDPIKKEMNYLIGEGFFQKKLRRENKSKLVKMFLWEKLKIFHRIE